MAEWTSLPEHSRVWIYQADRFLSATEASWVKEQAIAFVNNWSSHGAKLEASVELFDQLFLVVFVNEDQAAASGCSIDKSVAFVKALEKELGLSFMDRMKTAIATNDGPELVALNDFPRLKSEGKISETTLVFDNLVNTKAEFERGWKKRIADSWHMRFLN